MLNPKENEGQTTKTMMKEQRLNTLNFYPEKASKCWCSSSLRPEWIITIIIIIVIVIIIFLSYHNET